MKNPKSTPATGGALMILLFLVALVGCSTFGSTRLDAAPKAPNSVLMILRMDAAISTKDEVKVVLNGKETIELEADSYKVVHLKPGAYEIEYLFTKARSGKNKTSKWRDELDPNTKNLIELSMVMGVWKGSRRFFTKNKFTALRKLKNGGEIDLTATLEPLAAK